MNWKKFYLVQLFLIFKRINSSQKWSRSSILSGLVLKQKENTFCSASQDTDLWQSRYVVLITHFRQSTIILKSASYDDSIIIMIW